MVDKVEAYTQLLAALLPSGIAWQPASGTTMHDLLATMAMELARIDDRGDRALDESDPRKAVELLSDWERVAGLPDDCLVGVDQTLQDRRAALVSRLTGRGGQSRAYFIELAAALGYTVTITEFHPFRAGISVAGDALTNGDWVFTWRINAPAVTITYFRAGQSAAGEPVRAWGNERLECALSRVSPAHTIVLFGYSEE